MNATAPLVSILAAAADESNSMVTEFVIGGLTSAGVGAIIAAVVAGLFSKKKLGAEATEIITKAAAGVVTNLESELKRQILARETAETEHAAALQEMAAAHVAERGEWRRVLQLHVAWDAIAISKLGELGVDLPPTPPLLPAQRHVDEQGFPLH